MGQATLSVRVDEQDKKRFEAFCDETGMNVSVAVNMFIKSVLREQKLPFKVKTDPFYSEENIARLKKSIAQLENGQYTEHDITED